LVALGELGIQELIGLQKTIISQLVL